MFFYHGSDVAPAPVLIVDDRWEDNFLLQRLLRVAKIGYPVHAASGGAEAIDLLQLAMSDSTRRLPFVVFLDVTMPQLSGFDVLQWMREQPALRDTAVVMLSASENPADVQKAYELGAQSYLTKYPSSKTLAEIVELAALPANLRGVFPKCAPDEGWPWNRSVSRS